MNTFLLTWNPQKWIWDTLDNDIKQIKKEGFINYDWTCMSTQPQDGDIFFIMQVGQKSNGIFCSGSVDRLEKNVVSEFNKSGKTNRLYGKINILLNPNKEKILYENILKEKFPNQRWIPQQSGIKINEEITDDLVRLWIEFIKNNNVKYINKEYLEGSYQQRLYTIYERNSAAREDCIKNYGYNCQICGINLEKIYGSVGKCFIHVHHKNFISNYIEEHNVDPIKDLITVCPNCHSMLHRKIDGKYLTIEDLKKLFEKQP